LIWYKDQILKSFSLEAMTIELQALKKRVIAEEQRERQSLTRDYPLIGFRKPGDRKADDAEKAEDEESSEAEGAKETVSSAAD